MCEETYSGCPNCKADTDEIRWEATAYATVSYSIDSDGDPYDRLDVGELEDNGEGSLYCTNCGESDFNLESDLIPEDCSCEECEPEPVPATDNYDEDWLIIERPPHATMVDLALLANAPDEVRKLYERRSICRLPVRVDRATVVMEWVEANLPSDSLYMRLTTPPPNLRGLAVPEPTDNQLEMEVAA